MWRAAGLAAAHAPPARTYLGIAASSVANCAAACCGGYDDGSAPSLADAAGAAAWASSAPRESVAALAAPSSARASFLPFGCHHFGHFLTSAGAARQPAY